MLGQVKLIDEIIKMQDRKPVVREGLDRVGVTNLRAIVLTSWKGGRYNFVPEIELTLDLDKERRGVHMSRLIESITEAIEEEVGVRHGSLEEVERDILWKLKERHPYSKARITMKTALVIPRKTPKSGKTTMETYDIMVGVSHINGVYSKTLKVDVLGNTVCPHAMKNTEGKTHIQRARGILEIEADYGNEIELEDMIGCVEKAFPSEIYTLLKSEDESYVVQKMFQNPKFVEDVTREILDNARKKFRDCEIKVKTVSQESIHRHDVVAEGSCRS